MSSLQTCNSPTAIWTGSHYLDLAAPVPEAIELRDICRAMSRIVRFNGLGTKFPWTVGQHLLLCDFYAKHDGVSDPGARLEIVSHDFTEAYVGDMVSPLKTMQPGFRVAEDRIAAVIARKLHIPNTSPELVKYYDLVALASEKELLISEDAGPWPGLPAARKVPFFILQRVPEEVSAILEALTVEHMRNANPLLDLRRSNLDNASRPRLVQS